MFEIHLIHGITVFIKLIPTSLLTYLQAFTGDNHGIQKVVEADVHYLFLLFLTFGFLTFHRFRY